VRTAYRLIASLHAALAFALLPATGCVSRPSDGDAQGKAAGTAGTQGDEAAPVALDAFTDGRWTLRVDRSWDATNSTVTLPSEALREDDYRPTAQPVVHEVLVSGSTVSVGTAAMRGSRSRSSLPGTITFELSGGTFAGGRFVVFPGTKSLEAELTLFGSGRPIVESHRGTLVPSD
jgi:hypothetical protein